MANLPETPQWEDGIYQIEVSDPVLGGPDGISNRQGKQLASRTLYLKQQVEKGGSDLEKHIAAADPHTQYAPKASPALTGKPTAPTAAQTANDTQLANTAFVKAAIAALVASSPEALDTLNELAAALGNDPNFATTMTNALAGKQPLDNTLTALSGKSVAALLEYLGLGEGSALPVGVPISWPSAAPPTGWLKCNGATFDKVKYPKLATAYPSGSLPDLRGVFIRGWDDGRGLDSGRAILSYAADKMRKHTHALLFGNGDGVKTPAVHESYRKSSETTYFAHSGSSGVYLSEEGQNETAPCNTAFNYIVRAA